jgi:hypothetical protein
MRGGVCAVGGGQLLDTRLKLVDVRTLMENLKSAVPAQRLLSSPTV